MTTISETTQAIFEGVLKLPHNFLEEFPADSYVVLLPPQKSRPLPGMEGIEVVHFYTEKFKSLFESNLIKINELPSAPLHKMQLHKMQ